MAMELYVPARGGPGTSHGIVGALTNTTINNVVVRIGDIVEFVHQDKRVSGLVVKDHYSKKPIIWGWASGSDELFSKPWNLKLVSNVENIRVGQMVSHHMYVREYSNESNSV